MYRNPINPDELKDFYYTSGLTLMMSQSFEFGIRFFLWLLVDRKIIKYEINLATDIIEYRKKQTLGQILKSLSEYVEFESDANDKIQLALENRNFFVHDFLFVNAKRIADPFSRPQIIEEIDKIRNSMIEADTIIQKYIESLFSLYGLDWDQLTNKYFLELAKLNQSSV